MDDAEYYAQMEHDERMRKAKRLKAAVQLLEYMRDRFGFKALGSKELRDKWWGIFVNDQDLWQGVDDVIEDRG